MHVSQYMHEKLEGISQSVDIQEYEVTPRPPPQPTATARPRRAPPPCWRNLEDVRRGRGNTPYAAAASLGVH